MKIKICVGSACHFKGSYQVLVCFKTLMANYNLERRISLHSAFCLGACASGVSVQIDDRPVESVAPDDAETFFIEKILREVSDEVHHL